MRKLLNTLYVTLPEAYLTKDGTNLVVMVEGQERFRIPIHNLEGVVTFGYSGASPGAMRLCMDHNVGMSFLTPSGAFLGRVSGPVRGNVLLRRTQYRAADDPELSLSLAAVMIAAKIINSRTILQRHLRDYGSNDTIAEASRQLDIRRKTAFRATSFDHLRGIEGDAAGTYFGAFDQLITPREAGFAFNERNRRPPRDPVNALLSFHYSLLAHEVQSALESVGLDPYVGFLHTDRPGRASLALDMMEELRAYMADRATLTLINRRQLSASDFMMQGEEGCIMRDDARKTALSLWQQRKQETITHPYLNEKIPLGLLPYVQAMLMARYLRGDLDGYPPFILK